jgi:hypothetical protein
MLLGDIGNFNQKRSVIWGEKGSSAACRLQMLFLDQYLWYSPILDSFKRVKPQQTQMYQGLLRFLCCVLL